MKYKNVSNSRFIINGRLVNVGQIIDLDDETVKTNNLVKMLIEKKYLVVLEEADKISQSRTVAKDTVAISGSPDIIIDHGAAQSGGDIVVTGSDTNSPEADLLTALADTTEDVLSPEEFEKITRMIPSAGSEVRGEVEIKDADAEIEASVLEQHKTNPIGTREVTISETTRSTLENIKQIAEEINETFEDIPEDIKDFLSQKFFKQKSIINKTTDKEFLSKVLKYATSKVLKELVTKKLQELSK